MKEIASVLVVVTILILVVILAAINLLWMFVGIPQLVNMHTNGGLFAAFIGSLILASVDVLLFYVTDHAGTTIEKFLTELNTEDDTHA